MRYTAVEEILRQVDAAHGVRSCEVSPRDGSVECFLCNRWFHADGVCFDLVSIEDTDAVDFVVSDVSSLDRGLLETHPEHARMDACWRCARFLPGVENPKTKT